MDLHAKIVFFCGLKKRKQAILSTKKTDLPNIEQIRFFDYITLINITSSPVYTNATNVRRTIRQLPLPFPKVLDADEW